MSPKIEKPLCSENNFFSDYLAPSVQRALPNRGSLGSHVLDYSTKLPSFLDTVSSDLCDDGKMSKDSALAALGFISRSSTTAIVAGSTLALGGLAIATAGAPMAVAGMGLAGLAVLPPVVEWGVNKAADFIGGLFLRI